MQATLQEAVMAESMVSAVAVLIVLIVAAILVTSHYRRAHSRERLLQQLGAHRLWDRMRHRH
jgi:hypothetical protein